MKTSIVNSTLQLATISALTVAAGTVSAQDADWKSKLISPVTNPIFFEDPNITTEVRPIFMHHKIHDDFLAGSGTINVYALQARWAVTDKLAIIATKDGYVDAEFDDVPALDGTGWADIAAGVKYALIQDDENEFILTPGLKFELPWGDDEVFQGNGDGEFDIFVSGVKGFGGFHLTGSLGVRLPLDWDDETSQLHYSLQADYYTCQWFIPFVALNGYTVLSEGDNALPLTVEGNDLINFGSPDAGGTTQIIGGVGFRTRLVDQFDIGFAYEVGLATPKGLFDDRFTVDAIWRF